MKRASLMAVVLLLTSCESKAGSGALIGAGLGVGVGTLVSNSAGGALIGGAVGAAAGGLIGASLDDNDRSTMQNNSPQTLEKIDHGAPLSIDDVKEMSKNGLSDNVIIGQIQATRSVFTLTADQIIDLKKSGVSQRVIDYMIQTGNK